MVYLTLADFTVKRVSSPRMLRKGGTVGPGSYVRGKRNAVESAGLKARMGFAAATMAANCRVADKCLPVGMNRAAVGQPVPGNPGKVYRECGADEAARRLMAARECAIRNLATKGGIYSRRVAA